MNAAYDVHERPKRNLKIPKKHKFFKSDSVTRQMLRALARSKELIFFTAFEALSEGNSRVSALVLKN